MAERKNYGIGSFSSIWWNEGKDGKSGYYSVQIRKAYKDSYGQDQEQKISFLQKDAIVLAAELQRIATLLLTPREIVRKDNAPVIDNVGDEIPF